MAIAEIKSPRTSTSTDALTGPMFEMEDFRRRLVGYGVAISGSLVDGEDLAHEALTAYLEQPPGRVVEPFAWAARVMRNIHADNLAARAKIIEVPFSDQRPRSNAHDWDFKCAVCGAWLADGCRCSE